MPERVDWRDLRVGHLDTGFTEHPVFGDWTTGAVWLRTADGLNLREGGSDAHDPLNYEGNPGHGTRTCSVVCGDAPPLPDGEPPQSEIGVAPRLPVVPCRIVNSVVLTPERNREAVAAGIKHVRAKRCQVISISLGTPFFPPNATGGMGRAVDKAYEEGAISVAAGGQVIDVVTYPGKYGRTIGVGGVTWQRRIWFDYEAGKEKIDVWAPAEGVLRADSIAAPGQAVMPPIEADDPGAFSLDPGSHAGSYGKGDGTSYATVHVAAAAAMWLLLRKDDIERTYGEAWQLVEAFRRLLRVTAGPINGKQPANRTGVLDIEKLLLAPLPPASGLQKAPPDKDQWD
jgi:subtilisin family serine protease